MAAMVVAGVEEALVKKLGPSGISGENFAAATGASSSVATRSAVFGSCRIETVASNESRYRVRREAITLARSVE